MSGEHELAWSFRPGEWYGVLGTRTTVLLPPAEKARVARVWELVDEGAGFDEVLDALVSGGLRDLTGFVLVGRSDEETRVVIRGAAQAHLAVGDEVLHVAGEPSTTWVERAAAGVTRIRLEVGPESAPTDVTVGAGLVRLGSAEHPPVVLGPSTPVATERAEPDEAPVVPAGPEAEAAVEPVGAVEPVEAIHPVEPVEDLEPVEPVADEVPDHDGETHVPEEPTGLLEALPDDQAPASVPLVNRPVAKLIFSSGEAVEVDRVVLVGRAPEPGRVPDGVAPVVVTVPSPHQEISSTHLEVRPGSGADHGSAVVTDLGSTNGTLVRQPGLPVEDLRPGVGVQLIPGAVVDLGDGQTIQVVNP